MTVSELYRKYGIINSNNYIKPSVGVLKDFPICKDVAFYFTGLFTDAVPMELGWVVDSVKKVTVFTPDKFTHFVGKGAKKYALRSVLKSHVRNAEKFYFVSNISKLDRVSSNIPVIISYAHIKHMYNYQSYAARDYDKFLSAIGSMTKDVGMGITNRTSFIDILLPNSLESIDSYTQLLKKSKNYYASLFSTFAEFTILELIKFVMYDHRDNSIFKNLADIESAKSKYFIIRTAQRFTLISVYDLLAMDDKNVDSGLGKSGKGSLTMLIRYLITFMLGDDKVISEEDIDSKIIDLQEVIVTPSVKTVPIKISENVGEDAVDANLNSGVLSDKQADGLKEVIKASGKTTIKDVSDYTLTDGEITLSSNNMILDKAGLKDPIGIMDKKYLAEYYDKDSKRVVNHLSSSGVIAVIDHAVVNVNTKISSVDTHTITVKQANGRTKDLIRYIPRPNSDGYIRLNNNEYILLKQKADRPIRKINNSKVALASFYGKLMISRGKYSKSNVSKGLYKILSASNDDIDSPINLLVEGSNKVKGVKLPYWYSRTSNVIRSFVMGDLFLTFDYNNRKKYTTDLEAIEKHGVLVGVKGKSTPIVMRGDDLFKIVKGEPILIGRYLDVISVDEDDLPLEVTTISIRGKNIPLILPILSYMSFDQLLTELHITYTTHSSARDSDVGIGEYLISFKGTSYKFKRSDREALLLLSGLHDIKKELKFYTLTDISSSSGFEELYSMLGYNKGDINELSLLSTMFVDPLTADTLRLMKEPVIFYKLLLRANQMLMLDDYKAVNSIDGTMLKSYDRLNGMLYHTLIKELRVYKNSLGIANKSMTSDPYAVMRILNEDGSRELVEDINPIAALKQKENTTLLGFLGRSKDSISLDAREIDVTEIGFISEASKESSAVGMTAYMASSPNIQNMSGLIETPQTLTPYNTSSTATNLSPFGETDDGKRKLFNSVQIGSVIGLMHQRVMPVLTGYESVIGERSDDKFVTSAIDGGIVVNVTDSRLTVKYNKVGKKVYVIKDWFSKETGGESFRHIMKPLISKGVKFNKGATLIYDSLFFGPTIYDLEKVVYKTGIPARIALFEDIVNYEDSAGISAKFSKYASSKVIKVRSIITDSSNALIDFRAIGEEVEYTTPLTVNRNVGDLKGKSAAIKGKTLDILKDLVSDIPKAEVDGIIKDIVVYYRNDIKTYKGELRKFIDASDARLMDKYGYTGLVDRTYSVKGAPLEQTDIEIKYYIEYSLDMTHRDKGILQNQLKFTVGGIHESIISSDGKEVDITMSPTSVDARVVDSAYRSLTTTTLMMALTDKVVEMWES